MPIRPHRLAVWLATAYIGLVVYATLYPLSGWRDLGVAPFCFLVWQWPRYWTLTDAIFNMLAYLPVGFLLTVLIAQRLPKWLAAILATLLGAGLSFSLETLQNWLPGRDPAMLDLAANSLGALLGSLLAFGWGKPWLQGMAHWQKRHLADLPHVELGVLLVLLWLLCQIFPVAIPLGMGDVRYLLGLNTGLPFEPQSFQRMAAMVVAGNVLAAGLLISLLSRGNWRAGLNCAALFLLTILLRSAGYLWQQPPAVDVALPAHALAWLSPAQREGSLIALALLAVLLLMPRSFRAMLAGLALLIATVLVNLTPGDPYSRLATATGLPSFFFNVQNLAHGLAALWPFLSLPYLLFVSRRL